MACLDAGIVFNEQQRARLREELVSSAHADSRVIAAAVTGSAAVGREDRWSDIDLALRLAADADEPGVVADWTERMYRDHDAVDHLDVYRGSTRFRVFLRADTLQIDLAFWPADEFGAIGPAFQLLFGSAGTATALPTPDAAVMIGTAWLYGLHARSAIARGRVWQAQYMIGGLRDQVLSLACLRHGLVAVQGRGHDDLPADILAPLTATLVSGLDPKHLQDAFHAAVEALLIETRYLDPDRARRLASPLRALVAD